MKTVQCFKADEKIPSNATFLFWRERHSQEMMGPAMFFFYEVPDKVVAKAVSASTIDTIDAVIEYLNKVTNGKYSTNTEKTRSLVKKWIKAGRTLEDFMRVIDTKSDQWLDDPDMRAYLRPQTLFGPKFEGYLSETPLKEIANAPFAELDEYMIKG